MEKYYILKYSDEHLEGVPVEYIVALEDFLKTEGINHCDTCPLTRAGIDQASYQKYEICIACPKFMDYQCFSTDCPCIYYGTYEKAKKEALTLIKQWKKRAGIT